MIESTTTAGYIPGASAVTVKLVAEMGSGRLLGGQIVGGAGAAKRIDTLAMAITAGITADEFINVDLSYAPPFSPVWDPLATAARVVAARVESGGDH
jgi:NADPH-dependent 2,4-dienoyl-CoA reductase/sulfur reductase-like enzyme